MLILLLLYLASQSWAKDVPHDTNYKFTNITSCPDTGYFFKTVPSANSIEGDCYLCFCQDDTTAICWQRENKKCDVHHYKHNTTVAKKETRVKRSPFGLSDIFFKDAAREVLNKKEPEVCKPYESSFSEGCPPSDWCLGCTVCDCDANGHWDCHILSFCDDEKKGKGHHKKGNKKMAVSYPKGRKSTTAKIAKTTKKTPVRSVKTSSKTTTTKKPKPPKEVKPAKLRSQPKPNNIRSTNPKDNKGNKKPTKARSVIQKGKPVKPLIIKKNDKNRKVVKTSPSKRVMNGTEAQMSEAIMKTMKIVMQQMWNKQVTDAIPGIVNMIQKRSFPAKFNQTVVNSSSRYKTVTPKPKPKPKPASGRGHVYNKSLFIRKAAIEERKKEKLRKRELEVKAAKAKKNNKGGKKPTKNNRRTKRDIHLNNDSDLVAAMIVNSKNIHEQQMTMERPVYNSSIDNFTTETSTNYQPNIDLEYKTLTDAVDNSTNTLTVPYNLTTTEPPVYNNKAYDTITETFSSPPLNEVENSTSMQFISKELKTTESTVSNSFVSENITTVTENFTTLSLSADISLDAANFTNTESISNETITTESSVNSSSVDDFLITVADTFSLSDINLDEVTNSTYASSISDLTTTINPPVTNSSTDNLIITSDTSWPYSDSVAIIDSTNMQYTSDQVTTTELPINSESVNNKLTIELDSTAMPSNSETTISAESTPGQFSRTYSEDSIYVKNVILTATDMPMTYIDSEEVKFTSTQSHLDTTTDVVSNSTYTQSTSRQFSTKSLGNNSSIDDNSVTGIENVLPNDNNYYEYTVNFTTEKPENIIEKKYNRTETNVVNINNMTPVTKIEKRNNRTETNVIIEAVSNKQYIYQDTPETITKKLYNKTESNVVIGAISSEKHIHPNIPDTEIENKINSTVIDVVIEAITNNTEQLKYNYAAENDIKYTKWLGEKSFKDKVIENGSKINKTDILEKSPHKMNQTKSRGSKKEYRRKINWKDIERKVDKTTKKYSLKRVINSNQYKNKRRGGIQTPDVTRISLSNKIENLRNVLKRLLNEFHKNNTLPNENKKKKTNAIKYLKKFFNKLFCKDSNKTIISQRLRNNNHTIQMLCESFGPCVINKKNKIILMKKIQELNNETIQILKSLRIIKGLLRLLDIPRGLTRIPTNETSNFKNDIHKLNIILKSLDDDSDVIKKLSETQRMQIDYIKCNTKVFKHSVARFTKILNQIIDLVSIKSNKERQRKWYSEERYKHVKRNSTTLDTIHKFKELLHNYNLIHNVFISKLIQMFSSLQDNSDAKKSNSTAEFIKAEYDTENIVNNLNKIKNLELALNQGRRQKRHAVRQDNAVEYLLMLMEYMLHQNYRTETTPVNDGIDLLIEAIKNAPDIKTVKKKVLNNNYPRTAGPRKESNFIPNISKEDNAIDTYIFNDDINSNKIDNSSSTDQDTEEVENESDLQIQKNIQDKTDHENTEKKFKISNDANFKNNDKIGNENSEKKFRNADEAFHMNSKETTNKHFEIYNKNNDDISTEKPKNVYMGEDNNIVDFDNRLEKTSGEFTKTNKLYITEYDDDNNIEETTSVTKATQYNEEDFTENPTEALIYNTKTQHLGKQDTAETTTSTVDTKMEKLNDSNETSLEWRNEKDYFDNAQENNNNTLDEISTTTRTFTTTINKIKKPAKKFEADLSDLSKESDEKARVKVKKADDVLKQKEEDLMNSLDYGTERSVDDTKDVMEDKFLNDYFAD